MSICKREAYYRRFIGQNISILIEDRKDSSVPYYEGLSRNYISVLLEGAGDAVHEEVEAQVTRVEGGKVYGRLINLAEAG